MRGASSRSGARHRLQRAVLMPAKDKASFFKISRLILSCFVPFVTSALDRVRLVKTVEVSISFR